MRRDGSHNTGSPVENMAGASEDSGEVWEAVSGWVAGVVDIPVEVIGTIVGGAIQ